MNEIHEQNYQVALTEAKNTKRNFLCTLPVTAGLAYMFIGTDVIKYDLINFFGSVCSILGSIFFTMEAFTQFVERDRFFPRFSVGDIVIYNPIVKDSEGESFKYNLSTEFPELNASIPRHQVHSIGKHGLLIKDSQNNLTEISFERQHRLILQEKETELKPKLPTPNTIIAESIEPRVVGERI